MIVDLHAHYPMHLLDRAALGPMTRLRQPRWMDGWRLWLLKVVNLLANYDHGEPTITVEGLRAGNVGVALSMVCSPAAELEPEKLYRTPPEPEYINHALAMIREVEKDISESYGDQAVVAHNLAELDAAIAQGKLALIHAIEGGLLVGDTPAAVRANVRRLAERGVAYITIAHLFWRQVATNAPAIPFLPQWLYRLLFPQPAEPLTELGEAMIRAMVDERVLIDVTHMSDAATDATLALLDEIDPERRVPLMAGHAACLFGSLEYNIGDAHIAAIARRQGVVGLVSGTHYMADGLTKPTTFDESMDVIFRHIDHIRDVTGSDDYTAFGSDLDGFIKPTLPGLETPAGFARVEQRLILKYGAPVAERICSGNALRVLRYWGR
jgi:microsomal dipeptidase-like Zn-dependent dipeptidase